MYSGVPTTPRGAVAVVARPPGIAGQPLVGGRPWRRRTIKLKSPRTHPTILTAVQVQAILDAYTRLRNRFLFALLWETGIRIGEALGLRHEGLAADLRIRVGLGLEPFAEVEWVILPRGRAPARTMRPLSVRISGGDGAWSSKC